jgi:hypothetical protein
MFTPSPPIASNPWLGLNYIGYGVQTSFTDPTINTIDSVSGTFIVPTMNFDGNFDVIAIWVGIQDYVGTIQQCGVQCILDKDNPPYFYLWVVGDYFYPTPIPLDMTVYSGDSITCVVNYLNNLSFDNEYQYIIINNSRGTTYTINYPATIYTQRVLATWTVETPSGAEYYGAPYNTAPLGNYGVITFTNCSVTVNGVTGPINSSNWQNIPMYMDAVPGQTEWLGTGLPSILINNGTSFSVVPR